MPEGRLRRTREAYWRGEYQRLPIVEETPRSGLIKRSFASVILGMTEESWQAMHQNAAEQLERRAYLTNRDTGDETPWGV
jgi:hypothetical protein